MSTFISKTGRSLWVRQLSRRAGGRCVRSEVRTLQSSQWGQLRCLGTEAGVAPTPADENSVPILDKPLPQAKRRQVEYTAEDPKSLSYQVSQDAPRVEVRPDKHKNAYHFHFYFLRDACSCAKCVDPSTKQKSFQTSDIPENIRVKQLTVRENGDVQLEWQDDISGFGPDHITTFPTSFFKQNLNRLNRVLARYDDNPTIVWGKQRMDKDVGWFPYDSYMSSDATLKDALMHLTRYGLIFLSGVPSTEESVVNIGTRIGPLRDSFYGRTWDVKSVPNAKNVAYTHQHLGLHMDLLYMANPPGLQLLHCLRATCAGGNSLFSDSYRAALRIRTRHHADFQALLSYPVTYHYHNAGQHYRYTRPTVELDTHKVMAKFRRLAAVNWSPPFQAPFEVDVGRYTKGKTMEAYMKAAKRFAGLVEDEDALFELKLEEGQCVVFNNRRVLHARRAFDVGQGERWLKGAYVDGDVFESKVRVLREESEQPPSSLRLMQDDEFPEESGDEGEGEEDSSS